LSEKKTMTLNLTPSEMKAIEDLAAGRDLSKTALVRQAIRLFQVIDLRRKQGEVLVFENRSTKEKSELMLL